MKTINYRSESMNQSMILQFVKSLIESYCENDGSFEQAEYEVKDNRVYVTQVTREEVETLRGLDVAARYPLS
jgi:hypothetical protein